LYSSIYIAHLNSRGQTEALKQVCCTCFPWKNRTVSSTSSGLANPSWLPLHQRTSKQLCVPAMNQFGH